MFFIGVFGIEEKEHIVKEFNNVICKCGSYSKAEMIERYTYFHFFFIPLFRWNKKYFVRFRCCNRLFSVPKDYAVELLDKYNNNIDINRLKEINDYSGRACPRCGAYLDSSFVYCPYCGESLKR